MSQKIGEPPRQRNFFSICKDCVVDCCKGAKPPITPNRRRIIENYLTSACIQIERPLEKIEYTFPRENEDGYCIFLDKGTRRCRIHSVKPETCVAGPITFDINLKNGKIEWFLKMEKICPLAGILYRDKKALSNHLKSAKKELLALVHDLPTKELCAILKVEEPETFKIDQDKLNPSILAKLRTAMQ